MQKKILVVDDDPINIMLFAEALADDGHKVMVATSGEEALECAFRDGETPDLVLLDIVMPGMDGYEVCRRIKGDARTAGATVIFITGMETQGREFIRSIGAAGCLVKPFDFDVLRRLVRKHLGSAE